MTAHARLAVAHVDGVSAVVASRSSTPYCLLAPRNKQASAWVYQASHGGGFVGGDDVVLDVDVAANARLLLASQSSTKVYRGPCSRFTLHAHLDHEATLVSWPEPVVCFRDAKFEQEQRFVLAANASALVVDAYTAGRISRGERWLFARLRTALFVDIGGGRALSDATVLDGAHGEIAARMGAVDAVATAVLAGPRFARAARVLVDRIAAAPARDLRSGALVVASSRAFGAVVRVAASSVAQLHDTLGALFHDVARDALGDDPFARRW
jgi:urease accessory protein